MTFRTVCRAIIATVITAVPLTAASFKYILYFPSAGANQTLILEYRDDAELDPTANSCAGANACSAKYRLERADYPAETIPITDVVYGTTAGGGFTTLTFTLAQAPSAAKGLTLTAFNLATFNRLEPDPAKRKKNLGWQQFSVAPQLSARPARESLRFDALRSVQTMEYQSLTPLRFSNTIEERAQLTKKIKAIDADPVRFEQPYSVYVTRVETKSAEGTVHEFDVARLPRARKVTVSVEGIESFGAQALSAKTTVQSLAVPKGRDDSEFYANIGLEADDVKDERKYKLDIRLQERWRAANLWDVGPTLDVTVGNKTSKAPNTAALSFDARRWLDAPSERFGLHSASIVYSPIYRTDRDQDNRDLGLDVAFEPLFTRWERPLVRRRSIEVARGGPPLTRVWGWRIRPSIAAEWGQHLESSSVEVEDEDYLRLRGGVSVILERQQWQLSVTGVDRYLFRDEVVLDATNVVRTSGGHRRHARVELAYNFGTVALTLTHLDGRLPPAFSSTHSTSFGVALKY